MIKGTFQDPLDLRAYTKREWVTLNKFRYCDLSGVVHEAPRYFITDLASIPWLAEPLFSSVEHRLPGVMHDALYCLNVLPRAVCDALLYEMLVVTGCDKLRASLIYRAVRIGGAGRYDACKGGPKVEDLAFELMTPQDAEMWKGVLAPPLKLQK